MLVVVEKLGTSEAVSAAESPPPRSCRKLEDAGRDDGDVAASTAAQQHTSTMALESLRILFKNPWDKCPVRRKREIVMKLRY